MVSNAPYDDTDAYCAGTKQEMAADAKLCKWPKVPPDCEDTWFEYVGESKAAISNIAFLCIFSVLFLISARMQWWSILRHRQSKKSWWDKTSNEWAITYWNIVYFLRTIQELDYGNEKGIFSPGTSYILTKIISGFIVCTLYSITWGWYNVLLSVKDKAVKSKQSNMWHNVSRLAIFLSEVIFGVLAVANLPDEYKDAGVYDGNYHGVGRIVLTVLIVLLVYQIRKLGNKARGRLVETNIKKAQVAPGESEVGEVGGTDKLKDAVRKNNPLSRSKHKDDSEKIAFMVRMTLWTMGLIVMYLFLDISRSLGKMRHITPPACAAKDLFVRLPSFIQMIAGIMTMHVFPVKRPVPQDGTGAGKASSTDTTRIVSTDATDADA